MKNPRQSFAAWPLQRAFVSLLIGALLGVAGCSKEAKKESATPPNPSEQIPPKDESANNAEPTKAPANKTEPTNAPANKTESKTTSTENTTQSSPEATPGGATAMLPKDVNRWFEVAHPLRSAKKLGLLDSGDGMLDRLLAEDGKQIQKDLGLDITSEAALRATGIALDRPMGVSWIETHDPVEDANGVLPYVDALVAYVYLHSPEQFQKTLKTLADNTDFQLQTETLDDKGVIHRLDKFTCIAVRGDVAMGFFQDPGESASTAGKPRKLQHPCKSALTRSRAESLASISAVQSAMKDTGDIRGYDQGELIGSSLHPILWMFLQMQGMGSPDLEQVKGVFAATVPETVHAQHRVSIGKNNVTATVASAASGKELMPNLFQNAKSPAWRGYFPKKPVLSFEMNLNLTALHSWWKSVSGLLKLRPSPVLEMLQKSGATGRLAIYGDADLARVKTGGKDSIHLHVFGEVEQPDFVRKQLASLQAPVSAKEGSTWMFPGPSNRKIWVRVQEKTLLATTDRTLLARLGQDPGKSLWSLPGDADGTSLSLHYELGPLALAAAVWNEEPIQAPKVEATWSKDPEVTALVQKLQKLRDQEATESREWQKTERDAVSVFWDRLGGMHHTVTRSKSGVDVQMDWQVDGASWAQVIKQSLEHAEQMKKASLDYRKEWHQGSLKREALLHEIQKRSKM